METSSTRLRFVSGADLNQIHKTVELFSFKVEYKDTLFLKGKFYFLFVIPDTVKSFISIDL